MNQPAPNTPPIENPTRIHQPERFESMPLPGSCQPAAVLSALLKTPGRVLYEIASGRCQPVIASLIGIAVLCLTIYGAVAGSLTGGAQLWVAPIKIIIGLALSSIICLPSLYVFLCLSGADTHLRIVVGELAASMALMSLLLLGFAPVAWVFSQSTDSIGFMALLHLIFWGVALKFGLSLIGKTSGARASGVVFWQLIFVVVCLQMMTSLRPILGAATTFLPTEKRFFLVQAWELIFLGR